MPPIIPSLRQIIAPAAVLASLFPIPTPAAAQGIEAPDEPLVCYRFAFGAWKPALDRTAAGHDPGLRGGPGAPNGRDWAITDFGRGSSLLLFPGWWPAGVRVTLPGPAPVVGDSAAGEAVALVADGRSRAPTARIQVWGVPCAAPPEVRKPPRR